jgi:hypothetical protein
MKRIQCPCCGYYTHEVEDTAKYPYEVFEICDVCFWQYDEPIHDKPNIVMGANDVSLNEARENYKKYGVCKTRHIGKGYTREPLPEELPENNRPS